MAKEKIIGIDLGTSNSAASAMQAGKPTIIPSAEGTTAYGKAFQLFKFQSKFFIRPVASAISARLSTTLA